MLLDVLYLILDPFMLQQNFQVGLNIAVVSDIRRFRLHPVSITVQSNLVHSARKLLDALSA